MEQLIMGKKVFIIFLMTVSVFASFENKAQVTLQYDNSIPVFMNGKQLKDPWAGGLNASQYGRVDINGDGKEDLVLYDRSSNLVRVFVNEDGSFIFNPDLRMYLPRHLEGWMLFRDYDCDGRKDIFTYSIGGIKVYRNVGLPNTPPEWELTVDPVLTLGSSGMINLQVNITDVPGIEDIDGDGDLDVLVYNFAIGGYIRYHRNMSVEKTGECGSLDFELVSRNWGYFEECVCHLYAFNVFGETCTDLLQARVMHPGGKSLLLIDMDNDGDMDFLGGHEQCDEFYYLENKGTSEEALMDEFSETFPDDEHPANFPVFPAGFFDDFDEDGIKDLVVSPNTEYNPDKTIDFGNSSWYYKNMGSDEIPQFEFMTTSFIQSGMIDLGENSCPVLVDEDGDGDLDLLVGSNGSKDGDIFYGYLTLFENTGNNSSPAYQVKNEDFLDLSEIKQHDMIPVIADLNHDGAQDIVVVSTKLATGIVEVRWYKNTAGIGSGLRFSSDYELLDIELDINDTPYFTDVNDDGMNDLLIGKTTGRLEYHGNMGDDQNPYFILEDPAFLGIDDSYIEFKRNLVPLVMDIDLDGAPDLLTTDYTGVLTIYLHYKKDPEKTVKVMFNELLSNSDTSVLGYHTWMTGGLISGLENQVIITGNPMGGLSVFKNIADNTYPESGAVILEIYPNPLVNSNTLVTRSNAHGNLLIFNNLGQLLDGPIGIEANRIRVLDIGYMPQGLYILKVIAKNGRSDEKRFIRY